MDRLTMKELETLPALMLRRKEDSKKITQKRLV
jgi:hypothetical protein